MSYTPSDQQLSSETKYALSENLKNFLSVLNACVQDGTEYHSDYVLKCIDTRNKVEEILLAVREF